MQSPNVVSRVMAESRGGQELITHLPAFPEERVALASKIKNKSATPFRAVSIYSYFQGQDFNVNICMVNMYYIVYSDHSTANFILQAWN